MLKLALFSLLTILPASADEVHHQIADGERIMISSALWSNPMEDWQAKDGWMVNTESGGDRNVVSLTTEIDPAKGEFRTSIIARKESAQFKGNGFIGFQVGLQGSAGDYRESAIYGAGLCAGITTKGKVFIGNSEGDAPSIKIPEGVLHLTLSGRPFGEQYLLALEIHDENKNLIAKTAAAVHPTWVKGLLAITASSKPTRPIKMTKPRPVTAFGGVAFGGTPDSKNQLKPLPQRRGGDVKMTFSDWKISGPAVKEFKERNFGPIWWATYTVDEKKTLRLLAQLAPTFPLKMLGRLTPVQLELNGQTYGAAPERKSYTALFEIPLADTTKDQKYSLTYRGKSIRGIIRAVPTGEKPIVVASMSCNDSTGFPHKPLVENITAQKPDFLTFHGDQIYEGIGGYGHIIDQKPSLRANICYLRKFAMHGWTWRELLMNTPSITIPDDHDVMHGNIWGEGDKLADTKGPAHVRQDSGGYKMSPSFVNMVHHTQTGNLPKTKDQPTAKNGISTYHTTFQYGPLDFLVLADRQFKSAPFNLLPNAKIDNGWPQNLDWNAKTDALVEGAQLLGPMQEKFLSDWADSPQKNAPFRILISQSPFLAPQTLPKDMHHDKGVPGLPVYKKGGYAPNDEPKPDFDTNGWPQNKQKIAVSLLKKAGAIHIVGDQHLGTTGRYGVDDYGDGSWWIATPAIANVWPRRWMPEVMPVDQKEGTPRWLGKFEDGFGNKFTLAAVANPFDIEREPARLFDRAVGYGITRYDLKTGSITLENWPYTSGPQREGENAKPYEGWPVKAK